MAALDRPLVVAAALLYMAAVIVLGVWAARRTRSGRDFFIAGQGVGLLTVGLATTASAFSGFVFLGGPGLTYRIGLASLFIVVPLGFTAGLLCWTVGKRLRLLAEVAPVLTIPDAIALRYRSRLAGGLAAVAVAVGSIAYLAAQLEALGIVLEAIFDLEALLGDPTAGAVAGLAVGLAVLLFYSVAGGMVAGVYTDLIQGGLMALAAVAVCHHALTSAGGLTAAVDRIAAAAGPGMEPAGGIAPAFLDPLAGVPALTGIGFFFVFGVGVLGQPHMLHKFYMLRDPAQLKWLPLVISLSQGLCVLIWLGVGLAVPALVLDGRLAPLANPDDAAPAFLLAFAPAWLAGAVFAGILAAIMSTADSFLNVAAAALVRDLPRALGRPPAAPRRELTHGRAAVVLVALLAAALALAYGDLIALLGTFAFGTFAAGLAPALAVGLNWRRATPAAAVASIAVGVSLNLGLELAARHPAIPFPLAPGALPSAVALAASFAVFFAVSWWGKPAARSSVGGASVGGASVGGAPGEAVAAVMEM